MQMLYIQPQVQVTDIVAMSILMLSNYEGPSITINNEPTPDGAKAF